MCKPLIVSSLGLLKLAVTTGAGGGGVDSRLQRWKVKKKEPWTKGGKGDSGRRDGVEMKGESKRRERGEGRGRKR